LRVAYQDCADFFCWTIQRVPSTLLQKIFAQQIAALKGHATVLFTTFRPSHMRLADRLIVLRDGQVALDGPPEKVLERVSAAA